MKKIFDLEQKIFLIHRSSYRIRLLDFILK